MKMTLETLIAMLTVEIQHTDMLYKQAIDSPACSTSTVSKLANSVYLMRTARIVLGEVVEGLA